VRALAADADADGHHLGYGRLQVFDAQVVEWPTVLDYSRVRRAMASGLGTQYAPFVG
jgi:hypothetical protein